MLDGKGGAKLIERVPAGGAAFAQAEQAVGEFAAIVRKLGADADRTGPFQIA